MVRVAAKQHRMVASADFPPPAVTRYKYRYLRIHSEILISVSDLFL